MDARLLAGMDVPRRLFRRVSRDHALSDEKRSAASGATDERGPAAEKLPALERNTYYDMLESTQKGDLDVTPGRSGSSDALIALSRALRKRSPLFSGRRNSGSGIRRRRSMNASATSSTVCWMVLTAVLPPRNGPLSRNARRTRRCATSPISCNAGSSRRMKPAAVARAIRWPKAPANKRARPVLVES